MFSAASAADHGDCVFVITPLSAKPPLGNAFAYDEIASGRMYVESDPIGLAGEANRRTHMKIGSLNVAIAVLLAQMVASTNSRIALAAESQGTQNNAGTESSKNLHNDKPLYSAIREAIYQNRLQLLSYLDRRAGRAVVCTPSLDESYDLFQASLREDLDVLWDLDIYASKYGLSDKQRNEVKACSAKMEKYLDNFALWRKPNHQNE